MGALVSKAQHGCVGSQPCFTVPARLALGFVLIFGMLLGQASAQETFIGFDTGRDVREVDVPVGKSVTIRTDKSIADLVVGDPTIADVFPLTEASFYVLGRKQGRTNVALFDADRRLIGIADVEVTIDTDDLRLAIRQAAPGARVDVQTVNGRLRLSGSVPDGVTLRKVLEIAEQYGSDQVINSVRVTNAQQVLLEVRLLEAKRSAGRELGVSWSARSPDSSRGLSTGAVNRPTVDTPVFTIDPLLASGSEPFGTLVAQVLDAGIDADIVVQALEQKGLARRLAEPNLVALSGEKASFHAGGEVPIPVPAGDGDITIIFKEFGVRLNFTPVVLDEGIINLKLEPEVSEPDPSVTIRTNDIEVPGFVTRRASTTIELRDGQSFAMAGLLQTTHTKNQSQLPWLGQVPVLGALFRSSDFQKQETDLVIIVTPHIVKPARLGEPLRTPLDKTRPANDVEFFLLGMHEVSEEMLRRFEKGEGIYGPYGHIIELQPGANNVHSKK